MYAATCLWPDVGEADQQPHLTVNRSLSGDCRLSSSIIPHHVYNNMLCKQTHSGKALVVVWNTHVIIHKEEQKHTGTRTLQHDYTKLDSHTVTDPVTRPNGVCSSINVPPSIIIDVVYIYLVHCSFVLRLGCCVVADAV